MAIYITGDIHGEPRERFAEPFANLTADDIVIVCGDFGLPWWSAKYGKSWGDNKRLNWLAKQPYTTVFVDGNHENFHLLNNLPIKIWNGGHVHEVRPNVLHLMRGEIFDVCGLKILAFGGAHSTDRKYRVLDLSWWKEEIHNQEETENLKKNLQAVDNKVDIVITHAAPVRFLHPKTKDIGIDWSFFCDEVAELLTAIEPQLQYKMWYFGHYHLDWVDHECHCRGIYTEIDQIL